MERVERGMMDKIDFKTSLKPLYAPSAKDFSLVEVPAMQFVAMDGEGPLSGEFPRSPGRPPPNH